MRHMVASTARGRVSPINDELAIDPALHEGVFPSAKMKEGRNGSGRTVGFLRGAASDERPRLEPQLISISVALSATEVTQ